MTDLGDKAKERFLRETKPPEVEGVKIDWSPLPHPGIRDLRGMRFGKLLVKAYSHTREQANGIPCVYWMCQCDCGNDRPVARDQLLRKGTSSCGCLAIGGHKGILNASKTHQKRSHMTKRMRYGLPPVAPTEVIGDPANVFAYDSLMAYACLQWAGYIPAAHHHLIAKYLEKVEKGKIKRLMIFMPPRHGKLCADNTPVMTPEGWKTHGELKVGDYVFGVDGKPTRVIAVSEKAIANVRVTFGNGESIVCHENHEWTVYSRPDKGFKTIETNHFLENSNRGTRRKITSYDEKKNKTRYQYLVPVISPLHFEENELPMPPYVLGAWLGDGSIGKSAITHAKEDYQVIDACVEHGYEISNQYVHRTTGVITTYFSAGRFYLSKFRAHLRHAGVDDEKHIPEIYKLSSIKQRLELLAGLVDTDGHVDKNGRITISTASIVLCNGIFDVANSLGFRPYIQSYAPCVSTSGIVGKKTVYTVGFNPTINIPTRIPRKKTGRLIDQRKIGISSVEYTDGSEIGNCIQVESPDGLYLVGKSLIPTHNSMIISEYFPAWYLGKNPDKRIIATSYGQDLVSGFGRKVRNQIADPMYGEIFPGVGLSGDSAASDQFDLAPPHRGGYFAVGAGGAITGRGANILIIDDILKGREEADSEAHRRKLKDWYTSVAYTRLMDNGAVIVVMTRWHCLLPGNQIVTDHGNVNIENLSVGESIITSSGVQSVQAIAKSNHSGDIFRIVVYGYYKELSVTPEHKILTNYGWQEAQNIKVGDWALYPIPNGETTLDDLVVMFPEPAKSRSKRKPNTTGKHGRVSKEKLVELMTTGKTYQEIAEILGYKNKQTVWEYAGAYGIRRSTEKTILNYKEMLDDPDFWRIVGYWLAEGCVSGSRKTGSRNVIRFTFSLKEQDFIDDIKSVLGKYGITVTHQVRKNTLMAHCSNKQLAEFLGLFGHGAKNKIFPEWAVLLPEKHIKQIIKGYVEGDGTEDNGWERITCASLSLLEGIRRALLRVNVVSSIMDAKIKDKKRWELRFALCCASWLGYEGRNIEQNFSFIKGNYLWERIKKISICDYDGDVYDIQTPSHDFISHGMTVHNCDDLAGWLLKEHKHEKWTVLNLPAISDSGEALWPDKYPVEILENIHRTQPERDWQALYQQRPFIEEGNIYKRQWWNLWPDTKPLPECEFIIQSWDTAYSDKDRKQSSYSARVTLGVFKRPDDEFHNVILIEYWKGRVEYPELRKESLRAYQDYEPDKVIIEKRASGQTLIQDLRRGGLPLATYTPEKDKITRAYAAQSLLENGRLYYPARKWAEEFISALARFPNPDDDDVADAFSQAIIWLQSSFLVSHADDAKRRQREDEEDEDLPSNVTRFKPKKKRAAYG